MQTQVLICRDGTQRFSGRSCFEGAEIIACLAAGRRASTYPQGLIELAEAETSLTGKLDVLVRRDVQKQLKAQKLADGTLSEHEADLIKAERRRRAAQAKADGLPSRKMRRFRRLNAAKN